MTFFALAMILSDDPPDRVAPHGKMPRKRPDGPTIDVKDNDLVFQILPVAGKNYHRIKCSRTPESADCRRSIMGSTLSAAQVFNCPGLSADK